MLIHVSPLTGTILRPLYIRRCHAWNSVCMNQDGDTIREADTEPCFLARMWPIAEAGSTEVPLQHKGRQDMPGTIFCTCLRKGLSNERRICIFSLVNTLRPRQNGRQILTTISNAFSWLKMNKFWLRFHCSLFPGIQLTIIQYWFG